MNEQYQRSYKFNLGTTFSEIAREHASRPALFFSPKNVATYSDLDSLSNRIAAWLIFKGIKNGDVIAIFNTKTLTSYACMIACLKIGVIYVNLDPSSPASRLDLMLSTCMPKQIWYGDNFKIDDLALDERSLSLVNYSSDLFMVELKRMSSDFPFEKGSVDSSSIAYIMFTSGSTGFPKAATISHGNLLNFISWGLTTYKITSRDRLTNLNPMHFDNSVFDFYISLFSGASLVPVSEQLLRNPRRMLDFINSADVTIWFSVPSLLVFMLQMRALKSNDLLTLRSMCFGGEGFPKGSLRILADLLMPRIRFFNVYGPTECTCICSSYEVHPNDLLYDELLPLGPIAENFKFLILDDNQNLVPKGTVGELYLGGANVGFGYFYNSKKSDETFVQNPTHKKFRDIYYRTGDLVRYDAERNLLFFSGRKDNQVKRMGHRIELEEIEHAIGSLPNVIENAVIFVENNDQPGRIFAVVNSSHRDEILLLKKLRKKLPPYMIPDKIIFSDGLLKNQNGKIDRNGIKILEG